MSNIFLRPVSEYKRDLNIVDGMLNDYARYIHLQTHAPFEECLEFVKAELRPGGAAPLRNPPALILDKNKYGDREAVNGSFMGFLARVQKENLLLSPSMAAYMPEDRRQSTHALYIEEGVANRKKVKGEMFQAERAGNKELALFKKGAQNNLKINNNSYSGATVSTATILHYKSTHSSLTSTCRTATSYANASNEKFIRGNRHYYNPEVTKANLLSICSLTDMAQIQKACDQYGLVYPSPDQVMEMIEYNTKHYWGGSEQIGRIRTMVTNMSPVERAAVMYVGDMYHLYNLNKGAVRSFLEKLSALGDPNTPVTEEELGKVDGDTELLANFLCFEQVKGRDTKQLKEGDKDKGLEPDPATLQLIRGTVVNIYAVLAEYKLFLEAFFMTQNMPSSIHEFPTIYRRAVPISDTDSTMFTLMWWIREFYGKVVFHAESRRIAFSLIFLISEVVMHQLALLSANMGVSQAKMRLLAMKNEYYFEVLNLTTRSKHYYASQDAQEGLLFLKSKMERKGVGLRDSKVPPKLQKLAGKMMDEIIETIKAGKELDMLDILTRIANVEREVIDSLRSGRFEYCTTAQVKAKESYKNEEDNSTFQQYLLWREVFGPTFGETQEPPYAAVKVSLAVNNKTEMEEWCKMMDNERLANRLRTWFMTNTKKDLTTLIIPYSVVETSGIPKEIAMVIDTRRVISNVMGTFYLMLESLGILLVEKNNIRLISDYY